MNIYVPDKDFFAYLTFDQDMLVQGHCTPFIQRQVKYEKDWAKRREYMVWTRFNKLDYYD